jgi:hypothetical protein
LQEDSEPESESINVSSSVAPPTTSATILVNGNNENGLAIRSGGALTNCEVMRATMTDVQRAIEQLGRAEYDPDGDSSRSFSFAISRVGDRDTENENEGAQRAIKEAEKLEMSMSRSSRNVVPPIEVELGDESEGEDEDHIHPVVRSDMERQHPYILEEDEGVEDGGVNQRNVPSADATAAVEGQGDLPARDDSDSPPATASHTLFPDAAPMQPISEHTPSASALSTSLPIDPVPSHHRVFGKSNLDSFPVGANTLSPY